MATNKLEIILEAVDKATPTITGVSDKLVDSLEAAANKVKGIFDKGLFGNLSSIASTDLGSLSGAFSSLASVASSVFSTIGGVIKSAFVGGVDLAVASLGQLREALTLGAAYNESITQSRAISEALGFVATDIEKMIDKVGETQITFAERTRIATKAVASGLDGPELTEALTFVKRWSEATGQEFTSAAETMFGAFATGRFTALKSQFGLSVEAGDSLAKVMQAIRTQSALTVETTGNFADAQATVNTVFARTITLFGSALDRIPLLQKAFGAIQDAAQDFGSAFEDSVPMLAGTFQFLINSGIAVYDSIVNTFGGIGKFINDTFSAIANSGAIKSPFEFIVTGAGAAAQSVGDFAKSTALNFAPVADSIGVIATTLGDTYSSFKYYGLQFASVLEGLLGKFYTVFGALTEVAKTLQRTWSSVWVSLTDTAIKSVASIAQALAEFTANSPDAANLLGLDTISGGLSSLQSSLVKARAELKTTATDFTNDFADSAKAANALSESLADSAQRVLTEGNIGESFAKQGDKIREFARSIDGSGIAAATKKAVDDISKLKFAPIDLFPTGGSTEKAKAAAKSIADERNRILAEADNDRAKAQDRAAKKELDEFEKQQKKLSDVMKPVSDLYGKIRDGSNKLEVINKQQSPQKIDVKVSGVNAPAWLQGLLDEIITQLVRSMKSERIPLTFTAVPA